MAGGAVAVTAAMVGEAAIVGTDGVAATAAGEVITGRIMVVTGVSTVRITADTMVIRGMDLDMGIRRTRTATGTQGKVTE